MLIISLLAAKAKWTVKLCKHLLMCVALANNVTDLLAPQDVRVQLCIVSTSRDPEGELKLVMAALASL